MIDTEKWHSVFGDTTFIYLSILSSKNCTSQAIHSKSSSDNPKCHANFLNLGIPINQAISTQSSIDNVFSFVFLSINRAISRWSVATEGIAYNGVDRIVNTFCHNLFLIESKTMWESFHIRTPSCRFCPGWTRGDPVFDIHSNNGCNHWDYKILGNGRTSNVGIHRHNLLF